MQQADWDKLSEEDLEKLLVERWLYRGGLLAAALVLVVLFTMISTNGLTTLVEQILAGVLVVMTAAAAGVFVYLRLHDRRIFLILQERRRRQREDRARGR